MIQWETVGHQVAIAGKVTDAQTNRELSRALVKITSAPAEFMNWLNNRAIQYGTRWKSMLERPDQVLTATDGHFHFLDLPNGGYTLSASLPGAGTRYGTDQTQVTVSRDAQGKIAVVAADFTLPPTTIKGRVNGPSATKIAMAQVRVRGSGEQTFSDSEGSYLLTSLEAGNRTVMVSARGYRPLSRPMTLDAPGTVQTLDITLEET